MSSSTSTSRLKQLAMSILESVTKFEEILALQETPSPSFHEEATVLLPEDAVNIKDTIIDCAAEVQDLLLGPFNILYMHGSVNNAASLQAIARFNMAQLVPLGGQTSFAQVAQHTGLEERAVTRLLRHAMTMRVFHEPEAGFLAHTAVSRALLDPVANDWLSCGTEEMWPACVKMVDALQKWPGSPEPSHTGFALADSNGGSIYQVLERNTERADRFASNMKAYMLMPEFSSSHLVKNYDWRSLGQTQMIDVGGGAGHVTQELAKRHTNMSIVVQDFTTTGSHVPPGLESRFRYMQHDMFAPQTVRADVYFFRWIFHNWSDKYCGLILKALIPVLQPGTKVIVNEICMPEPGTTAQWKEKYLRSFDLLMCAGFASHERSLSEWKGLFAEADPRFAFRGVQETNGSALSIMEFTWRDVD